MSQDHPAGAGLPKWEDGTGRSDGTSYEGRRGRAEWAGRPPPDSEPANQRRYEQREAQAVTSMSRIEVTRAVADRAGQCADQPGGEPPECREDPPESADQPDGEPGAAPAGRAGAPPRPAPPAARA